MTARLSSWSTLLQLKCRSWVIAVDINVTVEYIGPRDSGLNRQRVSIPLHRTVVFAPVNYTWQCLRVSVSICCLRALPPEGSSDTTSNQRVRLPEGSTDYSLNPEVYSCLFAWRRAERLQVTYPVTLLNSSGLGAISRHGWKGSSSRPGVMMNPSRFDDFFWKNAFDCFILSVMRAIHSCRSMRLLSPWTYMNVSRYIFCLI